MITIAQLYRYAKKNGFENLPIQLVGLADCGMSEVSDYSFFIQPMDNSVNLIVCEAIFDYTVGEEDLLGCYSEVAVLSDEIDE